MNFLICMTAILSILFIVIIARSKAFLDKENKKLKEQIKKDEEESTKKTNQVFLENVKIKNKKILNWLEQKWPKDKRNCEICNGTQWSISEDIIAPLRIESNSMKLGGVTYPQAMVICSSCGNTKYFNAVVAIGINSL